MLLVIFVVIYVEMNVLVLYTRMSTRTHACVRACADKFPRAEVDRERSHLVQTGPKTSDGRDAMPAWPVAGGQEQVPPPTTPVA